MKLGITKNDIFIWLILTYFFPILSTILMIFQWDENNQIFMIVFICIVWLIALVLTFFMVREVKNNPYPLSYLVDYETLIKYMKEEEKFSFDNSLEAGFHYYLYYNKEKIEIQSWHYIFSSFDSEKSKGNIYYWGKEKFDSLESLIENKIKNFSGYMLIELIGSDNAMLNDFRNNHKELDVNKYIEQLKTK